MSKTDFVSWDDEDLNLDLLLGIPIMMNIVLCMTKRKNAPPPGHVFKTTGTIFELVRDIIGIHCLTKFHEVRTLNVGSKVHVFNTAKRKNALPPDIIGTHLLIKFHDDGQ
ncbi:hypothetical protein DPMN_194906 [Dreissena polymorpha]|uniref:Uncharacterized protein n=1 Tax=Dreissena polymorpha TaxID=45954 RepID=A0A9D3Y4B3_DREPO|nr:hypothetical protein DPMN_194906 [Dreissena polymorpha]